MYIHVIIYGIRQCFFRLCWKFPKLFKEAICHHVQKHFFSISKGCVQDSFPCSLEEKRHDRGVIALIKRCIKIEGGNSCILWGNPAKNVIFPMRLIKLVKFEFVFNRSLSFQRFLLIPPPPVHRPPHTPTTPWSGRFENWGFLSPRCATTPGRGS